MNTTKTVQKINEYQVTKIKKYAGFLLKSSIGDIWDKNTAAPVMANKHLHIYFLLIRGCEHQLDAYLPERGLLYGVFDCA